MAERVDVLFLVRSLDRGGAERQLVLLATGLKRLGWSVAVATMYAGGALAGELGNVGVPLHDLRKQGRWDVAAFLSRLLALIRQLRPSIVHPYLVVPNLLCAMLRPYLGGAGLVWGVRASNMRLEEYDWFARRTFDLSRLASRAADRILVNSWSGAEFHRSAGYPAAAIRVIPNGIDLDRFQPAPDEAARLRDSWFGPAQRAIVGCVARLDPMKDHETFLRAMVRVAAVREDVRAVCAGGGPGPMRDRLEASARALGLGDRVRWLGECADAAAVHRACDVAVSSSAYGEGFSNALAEAMASGVPCVATDVGDSARILGTLGRVVPPRDPEAMAAAIVATLEGDRPAATALRASIADRFPVRLMVDSTARILRELRPPEAPASPDA